MALLDLTDLSDISQEAHIKSLCHKALYPAGHVAAVCVWPQHIKAARAALAGTDVKVATVANFPSGTWDVERVCEDIEEALNDGAQEIDIVLPYAAFLKGDEAAARGMIEAARDVTTGRVLKVILETGAFGEDAGAIARAAHLAIEAGADFIKTSTGKTTVSATQLAVETMLNAIRASGKPVGIKPSGGIRTLADAATYLSLADMIMGEDWAKPSTFRFGASSLHEVLIATINGGSAAAGTTTY